MAKSQLSSGARQGSSWMARRIAKKQPLVAHDVQLVSSEIAQPTSRNPLTRLASRRGRGEESTPMSRTKEPIDAEFTSRGNTDVRSRTRRPRLQRRGRNSDRRVLVYDYLASCNSHGGVFPLQFCRGVRSPSTALHTGEKLPHYLVGSVS